MSGRCPAPARTHWGTIRCVVGNASCKNPAHAKWRRISWLMAIVWRVKPWWPNVKGRAADHAGRRQAGLQSAGSNDFWRDQ